MTSALNQSSTRSFTCSLAPILSIGCAFKPSSLGTIPRTLVLKWELTRSRAAFRRFKRSERKQKELQRSNKHLLVSDLDLQTRILTWLITTLTVPSPFWMILRVLHLAYLRLFKKEQKWLTQLKPEETEQVSLSRWSMFSRMRMRNRSG